MKSLLLDSQAWDLVLDANGNIACATEPYARAQDVANECRLFKGEQWYDKRRGIPYYEEILGQWPPASLIRSRLKQAAESVDGVRTARVLITGAERSISTLVPLETETENYGNLLKFSEQFNNAVWTKNTCNVAANSIQAPDGKSTADIITASGVDSYVSQTVNYKGGAPFCFSVYLSAPAPTSISLISRQYPTWTDVVDYEIHLDTEWRQFYISAITKLDTTSMLFGIGGFGRFTSGEIIHAWGAQLTESGPPPPPYIQTIDVSVEKMTEKKIEYITRTKKTRGLTGQIQFIDIEGIENGVVF